MQQILYFEILAALEILSRFTVLDVADMAYAYLQVCGYSSHLLALIPAPCCR
ncbi:MAG: hypothetical protein JXA33_04780 [Anaerolineae bacterium]|nr:hypothetical protein [Anaerolineae bacterium]